MSLLEGPLDDDAIEAIADTFARHLLPCDYFAITTELEELRRGDNKTFMDDTWVLTSIEEAARRAGMRRHPDLPPKTQA